MAEWKKPQQELPERFEECAYSYDITFMTKNGDIHNGFYQEERWYDVDENFSYPTEQITKSLLLLRKDFLFKHCFTSCLQSRAVFIQRSPKRTLNRLCRKSRYRLSYCLTSAVHYKTPSVILFTPRYCFLDPQATARYFCNTRSSEADMRPSWQVSFRCDRNHGL